MGTLNCVAAHQYRFPLAYICKDVLHPSFQITMLALSELRQSQLHFNDAFLLIHRSCDRALSLCRALAEPRISCCNQSTMEQSLFCAANQAGRASLSLLSTHRMRNAVWDQCSGRKLTYGSPGPNRQRRWQRSR